MSVIRSVLFVNQKTAKNLHDKYYHRVIGFKPQFERYYSSLALELVSANQLGMHRGPITTTLYIREDCSWSVDELLRGMTRVRDQIKDVTKLSFNELILYNNLCRDRLLNNELTEERMVAYEKSIMEKLLRTPDREFVVSRVLLSITEYLSQLSYDCRVKHSPISHPNYVKMLELNVHLKFLSSIYSKPQIEAMFYEQGDLMIGLQKKLCIIANTAPILIATLEMEDRAALLDFFGIRHD